MIAFDGGPITPETCALKAWEGGHAFISWAHPDQIELAAGFCETFALDNGAYPIWKCRDGAPPSGWTNSWPVVWSEFYDWAELWLRHPACEWAVIPDVIDGTEAENDALIDQWPLGRRGVPVWHLNESIDRLVRLAADGWPRIALGSTQDFDVSSPRLCLPRLSEAIWAISDGDGVPLVKLHGLRMLNPAITTVVPLSSADSTNIARNIGMDGAWDRGAYPVRTKEARVAVMLDRRKAHRTPARMMPIPIEPRLDLFGEAS